MDSPSRPVSKPLHTFLQFGGIAFVVLGMIFNLIGLVSLMLSGGSGQPPKLLFFTIIGLPIIIVGFVMMAIGFTAAARRIRRLNAPQK